MCTIIPVSWGSGFKFHRWGVDWRSFFSASLSWWKTGETHRKHVRNKQKLPMRRTKKQIRKCTTIERYHAHRVLFTINSVVKPKLSNELTASQKNEKFRKSQIRPQRQQASFPKSKYGKTRRVLAFGFLTMHLIGWGGGYYKVFQSEMATILEQRNKITPVDARWVPINCCTAIPLIWFHNSGQKMFSYVTTKKVIAVSRSLLVFTQQNCGHNDSN